MASAPHGYLVISHAHPDFSKGGGELAAYNAFKGLRAAFPDKPARFLAAVPFDVPAGVITAYREGEYLLGSIVTDHAIASGSPVELAASLRAFAEGFDPEIINLHHFFHVGIETIILLRRLFPRAKLVMTLHEFLAICANDGQMIRKPERSLCFEASPLACSRCFPGQGPAHFELRRNTLLSVFDLIDVFISPSHFLRQRYVDWGLPAERVFVIENGQELHATELPAPPAKGRGPRSRNRFGYFGQVNPYKGLDVLLAAAAALVQDGFDDFVIEVNGANLDQQASDFQARIGRALEPLRESGHVLWNGPYNRQEFGQRIGRVDWLVLPSVWWENSPMVIQEAFFHRKPVICSGIGGMAEKVPHGECGWHVPPGSARAWADALRQAAELGAAAYQQMQQRLPRPPTVEEMARRYVETTAAATARAASPTLA